MKWKADEIINFTYPDFPHVYASKCLGSFTSPEIAFPLLYFIYNQNILENM